MSKPVKALVGLVLAVAVVYLLFTVVFPWVDRTLVSDPTLESLPPRPGPVA